MSYQQEKFKEIADAIREKTGENELIKPSEFVNKIEDVYIAGQNAGSGGYEQGFEDGKIAESRDKWSKHIEALNGSAFTYGFAGKGWNDYTFTPYTDIVMPNNRNAGNVFSYSGIADLKGILEEYGTKLDCKNALNTSNFFQYSLITRIPEIVLEKATTISGMFSNATNLVSIDLLTFPSGATTTNIFLNCTSLNEIRIGGSVTKSIDFGACPLNKESVESIVEALSDTTTGQTITFNDAQMESIYGGGGWVELKATKPNWTFALA